MDTQDLVRSHSSGHDAHGVHVCSKCGWPYPKAHPSSKHRRAHKRVCGTIDGYKLAGSVENPHLNDTDDEQSDEERKTSSPKVLERSNTGKGSGLIGESSIKSEDGVFSDAVTEFADSGSGAGTVEGLEDVRESAKKVESVSKNDLNAIQSLNGEISENTTNQLGYAPEFRGSSSPSNISSMTSSASAVQDDIKCENLTDASEDSKETHATDSAIESSLTSISEESKLKGVEASNLDRNLQYAVISPNKVSGETAEGVSKLEGTEEKTSDSVRDIEVVPSEKEHGHVVDLYIPQIDLPPEVESVEHVNDSINTAENKEDTTEGIHYFNSGGLTESSNWKGEGSANVHVLSVPDDIEVVDNPEVMIEGYKTHKEEKLDQPTFLDSWEQFNDKEDDVKHPVSIENSHFFQSIHLSGGTEASSDMHDLEASHELDGESSKPMATEVPAEEEANVSQIGIKITENQSSNEIPAPADAVMPQIAKSYTASSPEGQVKFSESDSNVLSDANSLIVSSDSISQTTTHFAGLDDNEKDEKCDFIGHHSSKGPAEENLVENPIAILQSTQNLTEFKINPAANLCENEDAGTYEKVIIENFNTIGDVGCHETEKCKLARDDSSKGATEKFFDEDPVSNLESASCLSELHIGPGPNLHEVVDAGDYEKDKTEMCDKIGDDGDREKAEKYALTGDDYSKVSTEKIVVENPIISMESASLSKLQGNPAMNLHDGDDSGDHVECEIEKSVISGNESREGPVGENLLEKPTLNLDSSYDSGRVDLNIVSETQKSVVESEIDCNDKVKLEVGVSTADGSDRDAGVELPQKSLEDCGMKELGLASLDDEPSVLSSTAAEDNSSREFRGVSSGLGSQSLREESDKIFVRHQVSPSAFDVVDSNSQADSLEGNWGSVSVLSIQSDAQAVVDAEAVQPTDSQASLEDKSKAASERQCPDKSDMFEAPSFMTLVEPGGGVDQKAAAAEIQTAQNLEQPKPASLQTGWFPSITQVVNESPGRKKNEEIIAKVTNWSTGKQHTPLKNLLGEAYLENKAKSPIQKETQGPVLQKDDNAVKAKDSGPVVTTVNSVLAPESPTVQAAKKDNAKEWSSPARYPSDIKSEKGKAKGRPYWAQFLCCSSVH